MKLHEYQAKSILEKNGIPIPPSRVARTVDEALRCYREHGWKEAVIKAQVLTGGRGLAGGIKKVSSAEDLEKMVRSLIGSSLMTSQSGERSHTVQAVLVEKAVSIAKELYLGITVDRSHGFPTLIFSESGGVDIEVIARERPDEVQKISLAPVAPVETEKIRMSFRLSSALETYRGTLVDTAGKLVSTFLRYDATLIEINPLVVTRDRALTALDAKCILDDNALFRHPDLEAMRDPGEDDPREARAKRSGLSYVSMGGQVGCLVNGAGLAMATMDLIEEAGGEPANFLDVGGGASRDQVREGFHIILEDERVRAVLVNIFGGIMQCDVIAQALLDAASEVEIRVPIVIRLEGTRVEEGRNLLKKSPIKLHTAKTMDEGAKLAVKLARR